MLRALDERHRLIWTSRPAPLKAALRRIHREHGVERWPQPAEVQVDAAQLDVAEKALILFRHAKAARLTAKDVVRAQGWRIVSHEHFTPERIRRFVARLPELEIGDDLDELVAREIREPTAAMSASFHALAPEHRALLVALLDTPPGPVAERELVAAFRRHTATGFTTSPTELVDRLADHFLRIVEQGSVTWVHPSWRDLVIDELVREAQARRTFLHASSIDGVLLALSTAGGAAGERILPLLLDDADWDAIGDRLAELAPKLEGPDITRLVGALTEALRTVRDGRRSEPEALAAYALELLARRWDRSRAPIPVGLLAEWFELESQLPRPRSRPQLTATWIDLAPTDRIDVESAPEVAQFDDWVALVELLTARAPDALARFGSVAARSRIVGRFVADVSRTPPQRVEQVRQLLLRLSALAPEHDASIRRALVQLSFAPEHHEFPPVYQPRRELSPELQRILDAPSASPRSDETLVARVLRDL
jgi:hypothetical protein